jgi:hypothetical protein
MLPDRSSTGRWAEILRRAIIVNGGYQPKDGASKSADAGCKEKAIHNAFGTNDLEQMRVSAFRDFPFNG